MQQELFTTINENDSKPNGEKILLDSEGKSWLYLYRAYLSSGTSEALLSSLISSVPWQQDRIKIAGKEMPIPRLQAWFGDINARYGYSGIQLNPIPWTSTLSELKKGIEQLCQTEFNSLLANQYRDGNDSVSWHADDESELGKNPIIASLSLGETRRFSLKHQQDRSYPTQHIDLHNGDLLIMAGETQHHWLHQVGKTTSVSQPRVNLTFRKIIVK